MARLSACVEVTSGHLIDGEFIIDSMSRSTEPSPGDAVPPSRMAQVMLDRNASPPAPHLESPQARSQRRSSAGHGASAVTTPSTGSSAWKQVESWPAVSALSAGMPAVRREHTWFDPASERPVRSAFDVRRVEDSNERITELTVAVNAQPRAGISDEQVIDTWQRLAAGIEEFFNAPRHRFEGGDLSGDLLRVNVVPAGPGQPAHMSVALAPYAPGQLMTQHTWIVGQPPVFYAHEIAHQLGLRDEHGHSTRTHLTKGSVHNITRTAHVSGSLLGDFDATPEQGLSPAGLRRRHLALLATLIGPITPHTAQAAADTPSRSSADAVPNGSPGSFPETAAATHIPQDSSPLAPALPRRPDIGPDIIDDWLQESAVAGDTRSDALRDLDVAVETLRNDRDNVRSLRATLYAIDEWRMTKTGPSNRDEAVGRLQAVVEAGLARQLEGTARRDPHRSRRPIHRPGQEEPSAVLGDLEDKYFPPHLQLGVQHRADTTVTTHVDGNAYFGAISDVLDTLHGPGDRLYITSWYFHLATRLRNGPGEPNLGQRLVSLAAAGVDVRVIVAIPRHSLGPSEKPLLQRDVWRLPFKTMIGKFAKTNLTSVQTLRGARSDDRPILTDRVLIDWGGGFDSRHEKTTIAYSAATGTLHAFVGGMDYAPNRFTDEGHQGAPRHNYWHEAGVQLQSGAAEEVLRNFWSRWRETATLPPRNLWLNQQEEPFNPAIEPEPAEPIPAYSPAPAHPSNGSHVDAGVRIWRSYPPYRVTPLGDSLQIPWHSLPAEGVAEVPTGLITAIDAATRYIYVEDQTLNPSLIATPYNHHKVLFPAIFRALTRGVKVLFVSQGSPGRGAKSSADATPGVSREINTLILEKLTRAQRQNFALFTLKDTKVHTKVVLVDDEFASIGSANFWDRSMTGDETEVTAAMVHPGGPNSLVADLRVQLWREHLRMPETAFTDARLRDLEVGLGYFRSSWGAGDASEIPDSALEEARGNLVNRIINPASQRTSRTRSANAPLAYMDAPISQQALTAPDDAGDSMRNMPERLERRLSETGVDPRVHALSEDNLIRVVQTPAVWGMQMVRGDISESASRAADELAATVEEIIGDGTQLIDIASLLAPTGRLREAVYNGLLKAASRKSDERILVRFLFGYVPLKDTFSEFTRDLRGFLKRKNVSLDRMTILVGQLSNVLSGFWNHAKIVAADGKVAMVGGHNLWSDTYGGYPPVHDISIEVIGEGAKHAQDFADYMWTTGGSSLTVRRIMADYGTQTLSPGPQRDRTAVVELRDDLPGRPMPTDNADQWHRSRALSLGQTGRLGDDASDVAKEMVIKGARHSLKISQQDIAFTGFTSEESHDVVRWIAEALIDNPELKVSIVVSSSKAGAAQGAYSWGFGAPGTYAMIKRFIRKVVDPEGIGANDDIVTGALQRLKVAPFVFTNFDVVVEGEYAWSDAPEETIKRRYKPGSWVETADKSEPEPANHAKVYIADDTVYYVGSDNLYPHKLAEFGYLVEGDSVQDVLTGYWDKLWLYSEPHAIDFLRDIIEDWETESSLGVLQPRSAALEKVDGALRRWQKGGRLAPHRFELNKQQLADVQDEIQRWTVGKEKTASRRLVVVDRLRASIQRELNAALRREAEHSEHPNRERLTAASLADEGVPGRTRGPRLHNEPDTSPQSPVLPWASAVTTPSTGSSAWKQVESWPAVSALSAGMPAVRREHTWFDPASERPVRSAFDVRRVEDSNERITELTVAVNAQPRAGISDEQVIDTWQRLAAGIEEFFNAPRHRFEGGDLSGDLLRVNVVPAGPGQPAHMSVALAPYAPGQLMTQHTWIVGQPPVFYAHEIAHQLGLRDEHGHSTRTHLTKGSVHNITRTAHVSGSLLGDFDATPEQGLSPAGLRRRHLALLATLIGPITPQEMTGHLGVWGDTNAPTEHDTGRLGSAGSAPGRVRSGVPSGHRSDQHAGEQEPGVLPVTFPDAVRPMATGGGGPAVTASEEAVGMGGFQQNEAAAPVLEGTLPPDHSNQHDGNSSAVSEPMSGSVADTLAAIDWQESSHSLPPHPSDENAVKACVSVAILDSGAGMGW
ncbi:phospholipase D-like domain-containing protein [Actinoallomurus sp. NPDC050550]|uniref:phospholipase D-like domain-containing protein n=1 Tax=Actinoallomurus sp. NPDC050550 TaxID=3154937 RepID=UPI0033D6F910